MLAYLALAAELLGASDVSVVAVCIAVIVLASIAAYSGVGIRAKLGNMAAEVSRTHERMTTVVEPTLAGVDRQLNRVPEGSPTIRQQLAGIGARLDRLESTARATNVRLNRLSEQIGSDHP